MRLQLSLLLLLTSLVCAQSQQAPSPAVAPAAGSQAAPAEPKVGPDDIIITLKGFCSDSSAQGDACKTTITRAQFEKLADTLQPGMSPAMRRQLATAYSRMLTMSSAAEGRGLDKTPHFDEAMHFARMQILAQELSKSLQAEAGKVTDEEIQDYYQKNSANFEQATLIRLFVPHTKRVAAAPPVKPGVAAKSAAAKPAAKPSDSDAEEKAGAEAMKKEADLLRARAVKGEDPDKLEKEAFVAGGLLGTPPPTRMDKVRRPSLPMDHQKILDMKPGEVSEVISDPSGNYIYKMVSKEPMPLDSVKVEIRNQISSQRYREAMQHYQIAPELNDAYFGPSRSPAMGPRGNKPPTQQGEDDPD